MCLTPDATQADPLARHGGAQKPQQAVAPGGVNATRKRVRARLSPGAAEVEITSLPDALHALLDEALVGAEPGTEATAAARRSKFVESAGLVDGIASLHRGPGEIAPQSYEIRAECFSNDPGGTPEVVAVCKFSIMRHQSGGHQPVVAAQLSGLPDVPNRLIHDRERLRKVVLVAALMRLSAQGVRINAGTVDASVTPRLMANLGFSTCHDRDSRGVWAFAEVARISADRYVAFWSHRGNGPIPISELKAESRAIFSRCTRSWAKHDFRAARDPAKIAFGSRGKLPQMVYELQLRGDQPSALLGLGVLARMVNPAHTGVGPVEVHIELKFIHEGSSTSSPTDGFAMSPREALLIYVLLKVRRFGAVLKVSVVASEPSDEPLFYLYGLGGGAVSKDAIEARVNQRLAWWKQGFDLLDYHTERLKRFRAGIDPTRHARELSDDGRCST